MTAPGPGAGAYTPPAPTAETRRGQDRGDPGPNDSMARKATLRPREPLIDGVGMDLYLSNDELAHLRIIAQRQDGPIETRITDRLSLIGLVAPTPAGWELTPEGWLAVETIESA